MKYMNMGSVVRNSGCPTCGRCYSGDPRTVSKLLSVHMNAAHNIKYKEYDRQRVNTDVGTGKILDPLNDDELIASCLWRSVQGIHL